MKVLLVAINYEPEPTGIGPYVASLARNLQRRGHDVAVITGIPHYPSWKNVSGFRGLTSVETMDDVRVRRIRHYIPSGGIGAKRVLMELTFGLGSVVAPWGRPDIVVTVSPPLIASAAVALKARLSPNRPALTVWTQDLYTRGIAELRDGGGFKRHLAAAVEGRVLRLAHCVIAIDERFRTFICAELGVDPSRVSLHRNWVHLDAQLPVIPREQMRRRLGWGDGPVALHAGSMGEKQGLEHVVAAARAAEQAGSPIRFVLMGHGSRRASMEELARGVRNLAIIDPVPSDDFASTLQAADVLLVCDKPGVKEMALPSKLTSYFTAGRPVVASTHPDGTSAALIRAAGAGVLVAPGDGVGIFEAVRTLVADPAIADTHGGAARLYAHENLLGDAAIERFDHELVTTYEAAGAARTGR